MPEVKILSGEDRKAKILVDGKEIGNVNLVTFGMSKMSRPLFVIGTDGMPDILLKTDIEFLFNPKTVREACIVLKDELENESSPVREAFKASIKSAIDEAQNYTDMDKLAERILERIIGEK